jgi:hypothetical protein
MDDQPRDLLKAAHLRSFAAGFLPKINPAKRTT